jgi:hypothetical protein
MAAPFLVGQARHIWYTTYQWPGLDPTASSDMWRLRSCSIEVPALKERRNLDGEGRDRRFPPWLALEF